MWVNLYLIVCGVLLACGLVLLYCGAWPRRKGTTPHCRRCGYNLTGLMDRDVPDGQVCPECGSKLTPATVAAGERRRRLGWIVAGGVAAALGLAGLGAAVAAGPYNATRHRLMPGPMLVHAVRVGGISVDATLAWDELMRRDTAGTLWPSTRRSLIDACLDAQRATVGSFQIDKQMDYLCSCFGKAQMSPAQQARLFQQILALELKIRPRVYEDSRIPWSIEHGGQWPKQFLVQIPSVTVRHDEDARNWPHWQMQIRGGAQSWGQLNLPTADLGRHTITIEGCANVYYNPGWATGSVSTSMPAGVTPCFTQVITMKAEYEGLPAGAADGTKGVADPALGKAIQASAQVLGFVIHVPSSRDRRGPQIWLEGWSSQSPPRVSTAFDVFVRIDGREYRVGKAWGKEGVSSWDCHVPYDGPTAQSCDVILRTSEDVARQTVDLFEIWDGEIVYKGIPVKTQ